MIELGREIERERGEVQVRMSKEVQGLVEISRRFLIILS